VFVVVNDVVSLEVGAGVRLEEVEPELIDDAVADMESRGVREADRTVDVGLTTAVADAVGDSDENADLESLAVLVADIPGDNVSLDVDE
jgi:hypothetical protein